MIRTYALIIGMLLFTGSSLMAGTVALDFGADYSTSYINAGDTPTESTVDADFDGNIDDRMLSVAFGSAYAPVASGSFTTPAGKSGPGLKYGISLASIDTTSSPILVLNRFTPTDQTYVRNTALSGINARMATSWYWDQSSFLNGANLGENVSFSSESGSLQAGAYMAGTGQPGAVRGASFLAKSDGQWYITSVTSAGTTTDLSINAATANWYVFDPAAGTLFFNLADFGSPVLGSTLTNITALGLYEQVELSGNDNVQGLRTFKAILNFDPVDPPPVSVVMAVDFGANYSTNSGESHNWGYIDATNSTFTNTVDADFDGNADDQMLGVVAGSDYTPTSHPDWTTPVGKSGPGMKYGISLANIDTNANPILAYNRFTPDDYTYVQNADTVGADGRLATEWYWEKSSFLNGANLGENLSFADEAGSLTAVVRLSGSNVGGSMRGASFLVKNDTQWYISTLISSGIGATLSINAATANWYAFDPAAGTLFFDRFDYGSAVPGSTFTNITALGVYEQQEVFSAVASQGITSFQAKLAFESLSPSEWYDAWSLLYPGYDMSYFADPDGDLLDNLSEYGLGGDPTSPDADAVAPNSEVNGAVLTYIYNRRLDAVDRGLIYTVERNANLIISSLWTTNGVTFAGSGPVDKSFEAVTNTIPVTANEDFLRLQIGL